MSLTRRVAITRVAGVVLAIRKRRRRMMRRRREKARVELLESEVSTGVFLL